MPNISLLTAHAIKDTESSKIYFCHFFVGARATTINFLSPYTMDNVKVLKDIPVADIQEYLTNCKQEFETSQLYSSERNEKFTNE